MRVCVFACVRCNILRSPQKYATFYKNRKTAKSSISFVYANFKLNNSLNMHTFFRIRVILKFRGSH